MRRVRPSHRHGGCLLYTSAFDSGKTYQTGDAFTFDYTANENYTVYYTVNGTDPDPASAAKLVYDPNQPPALDFSTVSEITIKAIVYDESYLVASEVSTYTVRQRATIGTPTPSIESGEIVRKMCIRDRCRRDPD